MTESLLTPVTQLCAFALGCALIHATRAHAATVTRVLACVATVTALLVLLTAWLACGPDERAALDEITAFNAI